MILISLRNSKTAKMYYSINWRMEKIISSNAANEKGHWRSLNQSTKQISSYIIKNVHSF